MSVHEALEILAKSKINSDIIFGSMVQYLHEKKVLDEFMEDFPAFEETILKLLDNENRTNIFLKN